MAQGGVCQKQSAAESLHNYNVSERQKLGAKFVVACKAIIYSDQLLAALERKPSVAQDCLSVE